MYLTVTNGENKAEIEVSDNEIFEKLSEYVFRDYFSEHSDSFDFESSVCSGLKDYLETVCEGELESLLDAYKEELNDDFNEKVVWG